MEPTARLAGPYSLDVLPAQLAFSSSGQAAIGFGVQNEDAPVDLAGLRDDPRALGHGP